MANQSETLCWTCKNACGKCPWSECDIRAGVVTYIHPQRRYVTVAIMVDGKEIKESFRPEEVLA